MNLTRRYVPTMYPTGWIVYRNQFYSNMNINLFVKYKIVINCVRFNSYIFSINSFILYYKTKKIVYNALAQRKLYSYDAVAHRKLYCYNAVAQRKLY
jgi:hypothetical protein